MARTVPGGTEIAPRGGHPAGPYPSWAMRMSTLFARTLREAPAEAEVVSHQLLLRAAYIRKLMSGVYSWLPLGLRTLRRVEAIIREEMDAAGAQEVRLP